MSVVSSKKFAAESCDSVQFVNTVYMSMLSHSCLLDVSTPRRESPEKIDFEVLSSRLNPGVSDHWTRGS